MRYTCAFLAAFLTLLGSGCTTSGSLSTAGGSGAWMGPTTSLRYGTYRDWDRALWPSNPRYRPAIACDTFGRCWQVRPSDPFERRYAARARPPGWADDLPRSARDRFLRPRSNLVCDRASRICYKNGKIDKSDTERVFGERAGDRADDLRDRFGTARLFVPQRGVACDRERRVCLEDGEPDRKLTRRYFGRGAARALAEDQPAAPANAKASVAAHASKAEPYVRPTRSPADRASRPSSAVVCCENLPDLAQPHDRRRGRTGWHRPIQRRAKLVQQLLHAGFLIHSSITSHGCPCRARSRLPSR